MSRGALPNILRAASPAPQCADLAKDGLFIIETYQNICKPRFSAAGSGFLRSRMACLCESPRRPPIHERQLRTAKPCSDEGDGQSFRTSPSSARFSAAGLFERLRDFLCGALDSRGRGGV